MRRPLLQGPGIGRQNDAVSGPRRRALEAPELLGRASVHPGQKQRALCVRSGGVTRSRAQVPGPDPLLPPFTPHGHPGHWPCGPQPRVPISNTGWSHGCLGTKVATGNVPSGILVVATHRQGQDHLAQEGSLAGQRRWPSMELGDEGSGKKWAQWPWDMCQQRQQWSTCRAFQQERQPCLPTVPRRGSQTLSKSPSSSRPRLLPANSSERTHTQGWWDRGGLTQRSDERTKPDAAGALQGGVCYCHCHHGQQMRSWALSPDAQSPYPGPMLDLPRALLLTFTWLLLAQICPAWDPATCWRPLGAVRADLPTV